VAGGTISFHLFSDAQCQNQNEINTGLTPVTVNGDGDYNSGNFTPSAPGTYYWTATYSGDQHNKGFSTKCGDANESSTVVKATPTLTTDAGGPYTLGVNGSVDLSDKATLSGGTSDAVGSISFSLYSDDLCQNQVGSTVKATEDPIAHGANGFQYTSNPVSVSAAGTYHWIASYSGDTKNLGF